MKNCVISGEKLQDYCQQLNQMKEKEELGSDDRQIDVTYER